MQQLNMTDNEQKVVKDMSDSFLKSVEHIYDKASALVDMAPGLNEKIKVTNSSYIVRALWRALARRDQDFYRLSFCA